MEKPTITDETKELVKRLSVCYSGVVCDILDELGIAGLMRGLRLQSSLPKGGKVVAPAITVQFRKTVINRVQWDVHEAIDIGEGHVLVIDADYKNGGSGSVVGGLMSTGAKVNGLLGTVVDGTCRDLEEILKVDYPMYSRGVEPLTAVRRLMTTGLNVTIECAGIVIRPGDIIFGDLDGVVCVPRDALKTVVEMAEKLFSKENTFEQDIKNGTPLVKVFSSLKSTEEMYHNKGPE